VYASAAGSEDGTECPWTSASDLAALSAAYAKSRRSIKRRRPSDADFTGLTTAALSVELGMSRWSILSVLLRGCESRCRSFSHGSDPSTGGSRLARKLRILQRTPHSGTARNHMFPGLPKNDPSRADSLQMPHSGADSGPHSNLICLISALRSRIRSCGAWRLSFHFRRSVCLKSISQCRRSSGRRFNEIENSYNLLALVTIRLAPDGLRIGSAVVLLS
jgi:hypothetical protein